MKAWTLRGRLVALVAGAAMLVAAVGVAATWSNARIADAMGAVQERRMRPLVRLGSIARTLERQHAAVLATLAATNELMVEALEKRAEADAREVPAALRELRRAAPSTVEGTLLDRLSAAVATSQSQGLAAVLAALRRGQFIEADVASQQRYRPQVEAATRVLDAAIAQQVALAEADYRAAEAWVRRQALLTIGVTLLALGAGLLLASVIARALRRTLGAHEFALAEGARQLAQGRLDHRIEVAARDSGSVAANLNEMSREFSRLVAEVARTARSVERSAAGLSAGSETLSERTGGQASSLEQTAASMQQLAAAVRSNLEAAESAKALSEAASGSALQGREVSAAAIAALQESAQASQRVREIAGIIDAIAFQTNILALNAAVEAARAGEHGRGFAVVAAEVRALAQRCATAARDIRALVEESARRATTGAEATRRAAGTMDAMEEATREVCARMAAIVSASRGQASGIAEVNRAVEQLEAATQDNAGLAERVASDAGALSGDASALVAAVSRFSVGAAAESVSPPRAGLPRTGTAIVVAE